MTPNVHQRAPIQKCGDEVLLLLGCKSTFISSQRKLKVTVTLAPFSLLPKICCYRGRALVYVCVCMLTSFPRFPCLFRSFSPFLFPLSLLLKLLTALFFLVRPQNFPSWSKCTHTHTCRENSLHDADVTNALLSFLIRSLSLARSQRDPTHRDVTQTHAHWCKGIGEEDDSSSRAEESLTANFWRIFGLLHFSTFPIQQTFQV